MKLHIVSTDKEKRVTCVARHTRRGIHGLAHYEQGQAPPAAVWGLDRYINMDSTAGRPFVLGQPQGLDMAAREAPSPVRQLCTVPVQRYGRRGMTDAEQMLKCLKKKESRAE
jgi:hypothetical protein